MIFKQARRYDGSEMAFVPRLNTDKETQGRHEKRDDLIEVYAAH